MLFFSLVCFNIYNNEVVTIAEAAETVEMTETTADEALHEWIPGRRKGRFESGFFSTIKQTNMGNNAGKHFWGSRESELKSF